MTKSEYQAIRGEKDFLYRYFTKMGGAPIGDQQFAVLLNVWLTEFVGTIPPVGIPQIVKFLDEKFA